MVSHPLSTREALGSICSVSTRCQCGTAPLLRARVFCADQSRQPVRGTSAAAQLIGAASVIAQWLCDRTCGPMDQAPPSQGGDCGFESHLGYLRLCPRRRSHGKAVVCAGACWVHSSVVRAADCRSAGHWFKSWCVLCLRQSLALAVAMSHARGRGASGLGRTAWPSGST